ncbi:hypothetical protein COW98_05065 [Candidatus Roizmanbacteria bacterium CG22_combo_CG10-13_8_21_14_all_35_9]|uniref:Uncharacterized protein n=4 Tax=Candidatus Roizmaniibacteriota TaxID=1752723 RepID=A0A2M8F228_9BACT|nr:MAG: hypothetical protein COX47_03130 [Candidatus Roizmanbacteria bacterium CG23_combo_of_CG06-09_8_20_14_all_35_49]PIP62254.1 MAG: hypothetical protein COW98_05065 [Candidatus Roizmanbacteria bacterium CG22_combo_CG10-13_8_21_14_all_35_9]PIY71034.1 MAG: hypothetical protein COY88_02435 [Candidatus Roizmanbacteria bacterium CG_4_10_14_0_8_um_filter_35_28]PJC33320.1 MAG: hypothetical protein CO048_03355 [Candidatus Roizmanbacteria bacterium CG_4_9_14_0_2_um_filter_35_15]PJC82943.1 MAG: hypoth
MITDSDIKKLKKIFATKDDLKKFAAKEDLKRFATKEDLERYATKENLKEELQQLEKRLTNNIIVFKDEILHEIIALRDDFTMISGHRDMLEDHEIRIGKLEKAVIIH